MIPLPYNWKLYASSVLILGSAYCGWTIRDWQCDAAMAKALKQSARQHQEAQNVVDGQAATYEQARVETYGVGASAEREVRTIYREVPAASPDCQPDLRAIGLLQGSLDHANASATSKSGK